MSGSAPNPRVEPYSWIRVRRLIRANSTVPALTIATLRSTRPVTQARIPTALGPDELVRQAPDRIGDAVTRRLAATIRSAGTMARCNSPEPHGEAPRRGPVRAENLVQVMRPGDIR